MGMTIVETLFDVGQKLFGLKIELAKARQNRKQQVAEFLAAIAQTIEEANAELRQGNDAVVVATGGTKSRFFPWEGAEHLTMGLEYLKAVNRGEKPVTGRHVVVIGAGNSGMDTCRGAYEMGAESVVAVDVQKPAAFADEIEYIEGLGGKVECRVDNARLPNVGLKTGPAFTQVVPQASKPNHGFGGVWGEVRSQIANGPKMLVKSMRVLPTSVWSFLKLSISSITTIGITMSCSWKWKIAFGSWSRTFVSSTNTFLLEATMSTPEQAGTP